MEITSGIALDKYGNIYEWGRGSTIPHATGKINKKVIDISAGNNQIAYVTMVGKIQGEGKILNGEIAGVDNAVRVEVLKNSIIYLTAEGEVYKYENGRTEKIGINEKVIDISAKDTSVMYQTVDEEIYVSGDNRDGELGTGDSQSVIIPKKVQKHGESVFGMGAGYYNTYIIENTGRVYSAGSNTYGNLGNGTRKASTIHTLVGDRAFEVNPISAIMQIGDTEDIEITGNPFNVFNNNTRDKGEYEYSVDNEEVLSVTEGKITALGEGTAKITITDKEAQEKIEITRIVIAEEKDRIEKIMVDKETAEIDPTSTYDNIKYHVKIITNKNTAQLTINTKQKTDKISINNDENNWSPNGILSREIPITERITEVPIKVAVQNNNGEYTVEENYMLYIEKVTDDIGIGEITVTSKDEEGREETKVATPLSLTKYEVVVGENTDITNIIANTNSNYSYISIDGQEYTLKTQTKEIDLTTELLVEVIITVKSEAGTEAEYTLVIHKEKPELELKSLTVEGKEAIKLTELTYVANIEKECGLAHIRAELSNTSGSVSIDGIEYKIQYNEKEIDIKEDTTIVTIEVLSEEGDSIEYKLTLYREKEEEPDQGTEPENELQLEMIVINGTVVHPSGEDNAYIYNIASSATSATIRAIAKDSSNWVQIEQEEKEVGESTRVVSVNDVENTYQVELSNEEGKTSTYTVIIRKASGDTSLEEVYGTYKDKKYEATKVDDTNYIVKIPRNILDLDVTAVTGYAKSKVQIKDAENYEVHIDTQNIQIYEEDTTVKIQVISEDDQYTTEYTLTIIKMSNNTGLTSVEVDGNQATLDDSGIYHYTLTDPTSSVEVKAVTEDDKSYVNINNGNYEIKEISEEVNITAKETEVKIKVKAEDGTTKIYTLIIEGLSDDVSIKEVLVNGKEAKYIEGKNRYEIRDSSNEFEVQVTLNEMLASLVLGTNGEAHGSDTITVTKQTDSEETTVEVTVTSYSGFIKEKYIIAILEQSDNANLDTLKVNENIVTQDVDGIYVAKVPNKTAKLEIEAIAEDTYATTTIGEEVNESYIATLSEEVTSDKTVYEYKITVKSETGRIEEYRLRVEILEANLEITNVLVGEDSDNLNVAISKEDGNYYYKIKRVEKATVKVELESQKSRVKINGEDSDIVEVTLEEDITKVPITVIGEDGTEREVYVIIEKESQDTSILSITGEGVKKTDFQGNMIYVYVDENLDEADLLITLNNEYGKLRIVELEEGTEEGEIVDQEGQEEQGDTEDDDSLYTIHQITSHVLLDTYETSFRVIVKAEDGTKGEYIISVCQQPDLSLASVEVDSNIIEYDIENEEYFVVVANASTPNVVITPSNENQTVQILKEDGTTVLAGNTGILTTTINLSTSLMDNYIIKVISYKGEDAGYQEYKLRIRQKSIEAGIMYIKVDNSGTTVNSDGTQFSANVAGKDSYPVEIKLKDENAKVRIENEDGEVLVNNQKYILTGDLTVQDGETKAFNVIVTTENGNEKTYKLNITRISSKVKIESITVTDYDKETKGTTEKTVEEYNEETKTYKVYVSNVLNETTVKVSTSSNGSTITLDEIATGSEVVSCKKALPGLGEATVLIKLKAGDGTEEDRYLQIIQLPSETGIESVIVDENEVLPKEQQEENEESPEEGPDYRATVNGKEDYPVEIKLTDELAKVRIEDQEQNEIVADSIGILQNNLHVEDGEVGLFIIVVTAQDGTEQRYTLEIERISSNTAIESITVKDYNDTEGYVTKTVENYDAATNTYKIVVNKELDNTEVIITTVSDVATITIDSGETDTKTVTIGKDLVKVGITRIEITITAEDGTEEVRYLEIIKLSDEIGIKKLEVDDNEITPNEAGDYKYTVTNKEDLSKIYVELKDSRSKVSIDNQNEKFEKTELYVSKGENRELRITIKVTAEDETTYSYTLILDIISSNTKVLNVNVGGENAVYKQDENTYIAYIDKYADKVIVIIRPAVEYSTISHETEEGVGRLEFTLSTQELAQEEFETTFKVTAEDGETFEEYNLRCIRKSNDSSIKIVYIEDEEVNENVSHPIYEDGTYYKQILSRQAKVKVIANNEFATVNFNNQTGTKELEQIITLDTLNKVTEIPVTIISQQGETTNTTIYIEKISDDCKVKYVKVNNGMIEENEPNTYFSYIYSTAENIRVEIEANEENASIVRVTKEGEDFLDEEGNAVKGTPYLDISVPTEGEEITEVYFKVIAENGKESSIYKVILKDMSTDNTLKEIWVEGELVDKDEEGRYVANVLDTYTEVTVKAVTASEIAEVRISLGEFKTQTDEKTVTLTEDNTTTRIPITVRSQARNIRSNIFVYKQDFNKCRNRY